jgi:hypothetical protein
MGGFIRKREILREARLVVRLYGWRVFLRCMLAKRGATFLGILSAMGKV